LYVNGLRRPSAARRSAHSRPCGGPECRAPAPPRDTLSPMSHDFAPRLEELSNRVRQAQDSL